MLEIAVCDDTPEECRMIAELTQRFFDEHEREIRMDLYGSMQELLASEKAYGLYLLDVMMPGMSGIEGAACLEKRETHPVVVLITSSLESAVDGYRVNAAGFVLKPVRASDFYETMERILRQKLGVQKRYISVLHNRVPLKLPLEKVLFFENRLHRVFAVLSEEEVYTINKKLSQLQEELTPEDGFLRCHQSFLVNLSHVERLDDSCFVMDNGSLVPVSRNFYKQSKNAYYHYRLN